MMRKLMLLFVSVLLFSCTEEEVLQNELDTLLSNLNENEVLAEKFDENGKSISYEVIQYEENDELLPEDSDNNNGRI